MNKCLEELISIQKEDNINLMQCPKKKNRTKANEKYSL